MRKKIKNARSFGINGSNEARPRAHPPRPHPILRRGLCTPNCQVLQEPLLDAQTPSPNVRVSHSLRCVKAASVPPARDDVPCGAP